MKIATHNSEKLLLADLREAKISTPTARFLFMELSKIDQPMDVWLPRLERSMRTILGDTIEQIYLTHDHDLFIYGLGMMQDQVRRFTMDFSAATGGAFQPTLSFLYEVGVDYDTLETLVTCKIRALEKATAKVKPVQQDNKAARVDPFEAIDEGLVKTISSRRAARKTPEILIVEDDLFSQTLVKKAIGDYRVSVAEDGQGAVLAYVKTAPDICFLDIELPDISGHEVLRKIRRLDEDAFVVMLSGNGDRENILRALDFGAQGFVGKPFSKEKLLQYISKSPFIAGKKKSAGSISAMQVTEVIS